MASLTQLREAIDTTLSANVADLFLYARIPDVANLPAVITQPAQADFTVAMGRGTDTWEIDLFVLCQRAEPDLGQEQLDGFVSGAGPKSIRQAIFNNRTLGLADVDAHIARMNGYGGNFDGAGVEHVGAILRLVAHTSGTA